MHQAALLSFKAVALLGKQKNLLLCQIEDARRRFPLGRRKYRDPVIFYEFSWDAPLPGAAGHVSLAITPEGTIRHKMMDEACIFWLACPQHMELGAAESEPVTQSRNVCSLAILKARRDLRDKNIIILESGEAVPEITSEAIMASDHASGFGNVLHRNK